MRADRLLSTLLLLQANGKMTVRQIATRLEVSQRTAVRDLEALSAAGVPVLALRGSRGGWQLDEEWRTRVPGLDDAELRAFLMAQPRVVGDTPLAAAAERALDKFLAAMPVALRARAAFLRQRLFIDTTGWRGVAENLQFLPLVQDAVSRDRKLAIDYRKPDGQLANRTIDPLGIVAKGMSWYLVAHTPDGFRTFRVSRIEKATVLEVPVERPPDFDLATHWKSSTEKFRDSRLRYRVTARFDRESAEHFVNWRGARELSREPDGHVTLQIDFDDIEHAAFAMLGMATRVEVLDPEELREKIVERAKAVVGRAEAGSAAT